MYTCNEISGYWDTSELPPKHLITLKMSRNRFQELHMCVRKAGKKVIGPYTKVGPITSFNIISHPNIHSIRSIL
jgi:hypothetical protein